MPSQTRGYGPLKVKREETAKRDTTSEVGSHFITRSENQLYTPCMPINFINERIWYSLLADSHWIFLGNASGHNDLNNLRHFENDGESWEDLAWDSVVKSIAIDSWRSGNNYISKIWWNPKLQVLELLVYACDLILGTSKFLSWMCNRKQHNVCLDEQWPEFRKCQRITISTYTGTCSCKG